MPPPTLNSEEPLHHLAGYYTSSEPVQCFLTGVMLPNWYRAARHGSAEILLEQLWGRPRRTWACCCVALHWVVSSAMPCHLVHCCRT